MRNAKHRFEIRKFRARAKMLKVSQRPRLSVFKSGKHIYAQVIDDSKSITVAFASSMDESFKDAKGSRNNKSSAEKVGKLIGERAAKQGVSKVVFDKGGCKYHGVIKALADEARKKLDF